MVNHQAVAGPHPGHSDLFPNLHSEARTTIDKPFHATLGIKADREHPESDQERQGVRSDQERQGIQSQQECQGIDRAHLLYAGKGRG